MSFFDKIAELINGGESSGSFHSRMSTIAQQLGLEIHFDEDGDPVCTFVVEFQGESYFLIAMQRGDKVLLSACSNIKFPPGCLPRDVAAYLAEQNRSLEKCDYDAMETRKNSYFTAKAAARFSAMSAEIIRWAIDELVLRMAALDTLLVRKGYAN